MKTMLLRTSLALVLALSSLMPATAQDRLVSGVYVGGHIRRERPQTITKLRESGFTYVLLFNVHVDPDGTLKTDGETICRNGKYVFSQTQPHYVDDVRLLKTQPTSISRIEIVIGGWENYSYDNIKSLINTNGTGRTTMLYRNFKALLDSVPGIDAVNNDDEHCYDVSTATKFHVMMRDLGLKTTLAPYTNQDFWSQLATNVNQQRPGAVDRVMVQCYDGGAGNNPLSWNFSGIERQAGRTNYQTDMETSLAQMQTWKDTGAATGAFVWVYNDESWNLNQWAAGMNRIYGARTVTDDEAGVEIFSAPKYGGYSVKLPVGNHTKADLAVYGMPAKTVASIKVKEGFSARLYTTVDCSGVGMKYIKDRPQMTSSLADAICSILVERTDPDGIGSASSDEPVLTASGGVVTIDHARGQQLMLTDAAGAVLLNRPVQADAETLSLRNLPGGVYIVRVGQRSISLVR